MDSQLAENLRLITWQWYTRNSSGDETANVNFFHDNIFSHFYAVRPGSALCLSLCHSFFVNTVHFYRVSIRDRVRVTVRVTVRLKVSIT